VKSTLSISTAPFLHLSQSTPWLMWQVIIALIPPSLGAVYFFGISAILVLFTSILACLLTEWFFDSGPVRGASLKDGSALVTGILLALTLPPSMALWMVALGGVCAIGLGKVIWGGLGQNIFNPALLGRAFLQAAFPTAITSFSAPSESFFQVSSSSLAWPMMQASVDVATAATPLSLMKFRHEGTETLSLFLGTTGGSLGETSALLILVSGLFLYFRGVIHYRLPVSILASVTIFSGILYLFNPEVYPSPVFMMFSGGLLLGAFFMATDLVTSPLTPGGCWIFGVGVGFLTVLIRVFGGLPEGVMYSILLMNAVVPLIHRISKERVFGT
jgi:Na+-translocating ferredoxin:NAD+ oxidoreductase subunit D